MVRIGSQNRFKFKKNGKGRHFTSSFFLFTFSFFLSMVFFCGSSYAADKPSKPVEISAKADREKVSIGDKIKLTLTARNASSAEIWFPDKPENLGEFSFVAPDPKTLAKKTPKSKEPSRVYVLGIYTTGSHVIPPIKVLYRKSGGAEWLAAESPQVPIEVASALTGNDIDIRELKGPVALRSAFALRSVLITLCLSLIALAVYVWKKGRFPIFRFEEPPPKSAGEIAYEEFARLKAMRLPEKGEVKEYYIRLSDIVRSYLENRFDLKAPEMTTEEFLDSIRSSEELVAAHRELLQYFLSRCDMVKFAKYGPTPLEMLDSFKAAEKLVDETKIVPGEVKS